jgi:hypothetical protein
VQEIALGCVVAGGVQQSRHRLLDLARVEVLAVMELCNELAHRVV